MIHSGAVVCFIWTPFFCYGTVVVVLSIMDAGGPRCPIWAMGMYKTRKCKTVKVTDYKMRKYMRNYFHSLFTFTAVSATSDCQLQTDKWSYDARPSAAALTLQSGPSFKPTYEDERLPYIEHCSVTFLAVHRSPNDPPLHTGI